MNKKHQFNFGYFIIMFLVVSSIQLWMGHKMVAQISYSEFLRLLSKHQIVEVTVTENKIDRKSVV